VTAKSRKPREVRTYGEETRALVLKAAEKLFSTRGLHDTSMQDIAVEANVSRATVFNQFGSKQLVLDAITARSLQSYCDLLTQAMADTRTSAPKLLLRLFDQMARGIEANRALYREVFTEIRKVSMGLDGAGESPALRDKAFGLLVNIFRRGQDRGEITTRQPAEALATAYDSLLSGAVIQWLHDPRKGALRPMLSALADVFLNGSAA
jgi:AcrR family transcriptional regulator